MKISNKGLRILIKEQVSILMEQDDDLFGTEEETEEEEGATEEEEEETEDDEGGATEDEDEDEVEEIEPTDEEFELLGKTIDDELNALFVDFESSALTAGKIEKDKEIAVGENPTNESRKYSLSRVLFEDASLPAFDMETFAADVARLAMNYDSLLDMKAIIMKKAQDYIGGKYGQERAEDLMDVLELRYDLTLDLPEDMVDPIAVGASVTAAEGGA